MCGAERVMGDTQNRATTYETPGTRDSGEAERGAGTSDSTPCVQKELLLGLNEEETRMY